MKFLLLITLVSLFSCKSDDYIAMEVTERWGATDNYKHIDSIYYDIENGSSIRINNQFNIGDSVFITDVKSNYKVLLTNKEKVDGLYSYFFRTIPKPFNSLEDGIMCRVYLHSGYIHIKRDKDVFSEDDTLYINSVNE